MSAQILDGKKLAGELIQEIKKEADNLRGQGKEPFLAAVQVGENAASRVYIASQKKKCEEAGIKYELIELPESTTETELIKKIEELNKDNKVKGIILQMPLPDNIDAKKVQICISSKKDVEGMHPENMGLLVYGRAKVMPCTAQGVMELLKRNNIEIKGREVVVVGHSEIVGKPLSLMLLSSVMESATPTVCHIATKDLSFHTKRADILIVAAGKAGLIKGDMIKEGAIVIDVGINRVPVIGEDGKPVLNDKGKPKKKTVGDVEFEKAKEIASLITPVPGGVGPLTVVMLMKNTLECTKMTE
jgi:methylenetetrahydrofolate dehydrogenase (NADP+)/methenyltetrahydrofolate cyclohydrolase